MSIEFAGNPSKMSAILGGMRPANLGEVMGAGIEQAAYDEAATTRRNLGASDTVDLMGHKAEMSKMGIASRADIAAMQQDSAFKNALIGAGSSALFGAMKGSGFKLFGDRPEAMDPNGAAGY